MKLIDRIHGGYVHTRRVQVLAQRIVPIIPRNARLLDVGCGDGLLASLIAQQRPDLTVEGIDVLVRPQTHVPVKAFDGTHIDEPDRSIDAVMFVDVLHHTDDPEVLVTEAARVAKDCIIIKDHTRNGMLAGPTLRLMDWVSNAKHGVRLPYNYWPKKRWNDMLARRGLRIESWVAKIGLYPWWASWVFERELHFIAKLKVGAA
jgi:SAM-dependent methyltransferase